MGAAYALFFFSHCPLREYSNSSSAYAWRLYWRLLSVIYVEGVGLQFVGVFRFSRKFISYLYPPAAVEIRLKNSFPHHFYLHEPNTPSLAASVSHSPFHLPVPLIWKFTPKTVASSHPYYQYVPTNTVQLGNTAPSLFSSSARTSARGTGFPRFVHFPSQLKPSVRCPILSEDVGIQVCRLHMLQAVVACPKQ